MVHKSQSRRRSRKAPCAPGKTRHGTGRCHVKKSIRRKSRKASKSRRRSPCAPGKTRYGTGRCHVKKSIRRKSRKVSKSRRKSRKVSKSRRKSRNPCAVGKVRDRVTNRCRSKKSVPWKGWSKLSPNSRERTVMLKKCGKKCFLGPNKSFPICAKNTCSVNKKGLQSAYIRAKQWGGSPGNYKGKSRPSMKQDVYQKIAKRAKSRLKTY
jgi:hypothetical protein